MTISREARLAHLAALFAVSNMGLFTYMEDRHIVGRPEHWRDDPESEVENVAGFLMESDEHERIFGEEALMWYDELKHQDFDAIRKRYSYNGWVARVLDVEVEDGPGDKA